MNQKKNSEFRWILFILHITQDLFQKYFHFILFLHDQLQWLLNASDILKIILQWRSHHPNFLNILNHINCFSWSWTTRPDTLLGPGPTSELAWIFNHSVKHNPSDHFRKKKRMDMSASNNNFYILIYILIEIAIIFVRIWWNNFILH